MRQFNLSSRRAYPWIFVALAVIADVVVFFVVPSPRNVDLLVPVTGAVAAFVYFLYTQHLQETRLFAELFHEFNTRYNDLNEGLNDIAYREQSSMLSLEDRQVLFDYFNLCAEEYLYFKSGYIDLEVWQSWVSGMRFFAKSPEVLRLWSEELRSSSYYGFSLALLSAET